MHLKSSYARNNFNSWQTILRLYIVRLPRAVLVFDDDMRIVQAS